MDRTKVMQTVWRGEAVDDPADAQAAVDVARAELRRRRRMRPFVALAATFGIVLAVIDAVEGTVGPAIALFVLAAVLVFQWRRTPRLIERLEQAERLNEELVSNQ
jgi:Flp pilus assembly protein TadB